ncbi:hypothetical protein HZI73_23620 [Vallitalea pronyensis]|uniref:Uncharacterized protein n=1 Tax=Vallitalea pronyensis TaxID=1348613 RepID=A0A8J8MPC3_9FIRM|nr:hypothetical protein [Vallitalea pronyensis]QUI25101.1 hypothetical protein HZI73_23620 [Vallitalea pronyensis]
MEGEMGTGARIAIALIILGVLISVVFTIMGFTRSTTNQGISSVQNSLGSMQLAVFDDYDQKILSGTQVLSALKLFEGQPAGLVVRTKTQITNSEGTNYGALFAGVTNNTTGVPPKNAGESWYTYTIALDSDNNMSYNMNYLPASKAGSETFIRPTAKFLAELIKDTTGTIVGICFSQQ